MAKGLCGYGRCPDGKVGCPRAQLDMTPCVARDGKLAVANDGCCVGCGQHPADLLKEAVETLSRIRSGGNIAERKVMREAFFHKRSVG